MDFVKKCDKCQRFAESYRAPPEVLHSMASPWPFNRWGVDILGPFPLALGQIKFLVREAAHIREFAIKARVAKLYNRRVISRNFNPKDLVLRKIVHKAESNKLTPKWEGPFRVKKEVGRGAYKLETLRGKEIPRTWNVGSLRMYYKYNSCKCHPIRSALDSPRISPKWQLNKVDHGLDSDKSCKCHPIRSALDSPRISPKWQLNKVDHGLDSDKSYKCHHTRSAKDST
ncbi:hypothetical protein CR513_20736, partial [Mucuna pruriens]